MNDGFFSGRYIDAQGREISEHFFLPSARAVRLEILRKGGTPLRIHRSHDSLFNREVFSRDDRIDFLHSMRFHMQTGDSLGRALELVIRQETNPRILRQYQPALEILRRGGSFSAAIGALKMFDRSVIATLRAGEASGMIEAMDAAIQYLETKRASWKPFAAAMGWLGADLLSAISTVFTIQFYGIPWLTKNGIKTHDAHAADVYHNALLTARAVNGSVLLATVLIALFLGIGLGLYFFGGPQNRDWIEARLAKVPLLRTILFDGAFADTFNIAGRMLRGGVSFVETVRTCATASFIPGIRVYWSEAEKRVLNGLTPGRALLSPLLWHREKIKLEAHQNRQQLSEILLAMSGQRREGAKKAIEWLIRIAILMNVGYVGLAIGIGVWLLSIQDGGLMATMQSIGGGL